MKKLLLIGNAYSTPANRRKAEEFSRWFDVTCVSHLAKGMTIMGRVLEEDVLESDDKNYDMRLLEAGGRRRGGTRYWLKGLAELMRSVRPDIILVETEPWALIFWQSRRLKSRYCPDAKLGLFSWENIRRPGWKGFVLDRVYRAAGASLDFVVAGNRGGRALFERAGVPPGKIHIDAQLGFMPGNVPADPGEFRRKWRSEHGVPDDALIIGYCGRFVPEKGMEELIGAVSLLRQTHKDVVLHLLGGGEMEEELRALGHGWMTVHDPVPHDEVATVMSAWDIFVLPSKRLEKKGRLWEEQFGHVLVQAMGVGLLVLGSRSGAIPEALGDDEEVIFESGSAEALKNRLDYFLGHRAHWREKVTIQTRRGLEHYSFASIVDRYVKHLKELGLY